MRRFVTAAALVGVAMFTVAPAQASANTIVAGPGAAVSGYATPVAAAVRAGGAPVTFVNADAIAPHDVRSTRTRTVGSSAVPLFKTPVINAGTATVTFLSNVIPGEYEFYCTVHTNMRGKLTLVD